MDCVTSTRADGSKIISLTQWEWLTGFDPQQVSGPPAFILTAFWPRFVS
jgi:hypothetical protein